MRRRIKLVALLSGFALVASACGDDATTPGVDDDLPDLAGQSLEVAAVWTGSEQASFEAVLNAFADDTGASVTFTSTGDDIASVIGPRIEGGQPPDIAVLPQPGLMADLVAQNALIPIEDTVGDAVDSNYAPVWRELGSVDGTLYGVWFKAANKSTFWYNANVFADAGLDPPETWDDLLAAAETLSAFGVPPFSVGGADGWTLTDWFENVYMRTAGGDLYDQLTNHEIPWTHDSVKEALERLAEVFRDDWMVGGTSGALNTGYVESVVDAFSDPPRAAMMYEGAFVAGEITAETTAELGTDADFFDFPSIDGSPPSVVGGGDVAVLLTDSEAGRAFIRYLATPEAAEVWAARGGFTSPNQNVDLSVYPDDITRRSAESLANAELFRFDLSDLQPAEFGSTVGAGLFALFQDFLADPDDIDGVTEAMEAAAQRAFG